LAKRVKRIPHSYRLEEDCARVVLVLGAEKPPASRDTAFLALEGKGGLTSVVVSSEVFEGYRRESHVSLCRICQP
jgi:hypothetical protein